jgi:glutathione S-transferase
MSEPRGRVRIVGSYLSPYVRKVLAVLHVKGIAYEIDPIIAFMGDERFSQISPVRRIPVLMDDRVTLADSSVICQYLEDRYPQPALYPADVADRARARWLEEYADTRMGDVFIWQLFNQVAIGPYVWGRKTDEAALQKTLTTEMPQVLDYLESQVPADGFFFGAFSIADISVSAFFRNAAFARFSVDASRWPKTAAWAARALAHPSFESLKAYEDKMIRTPIPQHREALAAMGAPLMQETYGTGQPRPGLMRI